MRRSEGATPFSTNTLVGRDAFVGVGIPAGRYGSVLVKAEGQTHEFSATASQDIPAGSVVRITGTAGTGLIVALIREPSATGGTGATSEGGTDRG
jgi:membrane protein implicated in regulation of membrane protease activity